MTDSSNERPEPNAWKWQQYIHLNTNSTTRLSVRQPEEIAEEDLDTPERINLVPESKEMLWSGETIRAEIDKADSLDELEEVFSGDE